MAATKTEPGAPSTSGAPPVEAQKLSNLHQLTGGPAVLYFVGLTAEAPFEYITVPTVILTGNVRGTCPSVPKRTARMSQDGKGQLIHGEGQRVGAFVKMYPVEYEGFLKYLRTHVFRKTAEYKVPKAPEEGGGEATFWRADIETVDPLPNAIRTLGDERSISEETLEKYVWVVPAQVGRDGKPFDMGPQQTVAEMRAAGLIK